MLIALILLYLQFQSVPLMNIKIFAGVFSSVHSLMKGINMNGSCQAHLSVHTLRTSNSFAKSDTNGVIDSEPQLRRTSNRTKVPTIVLT